MKYGGFVFIALALWLFLSWRSSRDERWSPTSRRVTFPHNSPVQSFGRVAVHRWTSAATADRLPGAARCSSLATRDSRLSRVALPRKAQSAFGTFAATSAHRAARAIEAGPSSRWLLAHRC